MLTSDPEFEADCDLADLMRGPDQVVDPVPVATMGIFMRRDR